MNSVKGSVEWIFSKISNIFCILKLVIHHQRELTIENWRKLRRNQCKSVYWIVYSRIRGALSRRVVSLSNSPTDLKFCYCTENVILKRFCSCIFFEIVDILEVTWEVFNFGKIGFLYFCFYNMRLLQNVITYIVFTRFSPFKCQKKDE